MKLLIEFKQWVIYIVFGSPQKIVKKQRVKNKFIVNKVNNKKREPF